MVEYFNAGEYFTGATVKLHSYEQFNCQGFVQAIRSCEDMRPRSNAVTVESAHDWLDYADCMLYEYD